VLGTYGVETVNGNVALIKVIFQFYLEGEEESFE
jgi:hypothetical protein